MPWKMHSTQRGRRVYSSSLKIPACSACVGRDNKLAFKGFLYPLPLGILFGYLFTSYYEGFTPDFKGIVAMLGTGFIPSAIGIAIAISHSDSDDNVKRWMKQYAVFPALNCPHCKKPLDFPGLVACPHCEELLVH